ncbi:hypothetical protein CEXT_392781 [Caerostris extrusa]|uniref:Uncharacterized protein n=1 Tax=Caerostris extrusa TaxID=172846 RepID=A0AAV4MUU7_CAEEX|nr:hypothetical protein CEXT_392781 [Caerostris extrusa]
MARIPVPLLQSTARKLSSSPRTSYFPVSDKQEKPSASHPCTTSLMTTPPPLSRHGPVNPTDGNGLNIGSFWKTRMHPLSRTNTRQCLLPKGHGAVRDVTKKGPDRRTP